MWGTPPINADGGPILTSHREFLILIFSFFVLNLPFWLVNGYKIGCKIPFKYGKNTLKIVLILC